MNRRSKTSIGRWLTIWLLAGLLVACGGGAAAPAATEAAPTPAPVEPTATPAAPPAEEPPAQPAVLALSVGVNAQFRPFVYLDETGRVVGFDIDLMNALAEAGGFEFGFVDLAFEELLAQVENGQIDAAISAITVTDARRQLFDFSEPYFGQEQATMSYYTGGQGLAVRTAVTTILGLDGITPEMTIGVKEGTTGASFVAEQSEASVTAFPEAEPAFQALAAGEVDAVVVDIPVIANYIRSTPNAGIKLAGPPLTQEQYAIAVTKAKPEVLALLNDALTKIHDNGAYDAIVQKWFGAP